MDAENIINEISRLLAAGNCRRAYQLWRDLREIANEGQALGVNINEIRDTIEQASQTQQQAIITKLNTLTSRDINIGEFDADESSRLLEQLYAATLEDENGLQYSDYGRLEKRIESLKREKEQLRVYNHTFQQVDGLWQEARAMTRDEQSIGSEVLLGKFKQAQDIVEEAVSNYPNNTLLIELQNQARAEREKYARETEVMTSGFLTEDFSIALKHINDLHADEMVMTYDLTGRPLGRMPQEEARNQVIDQARPYIRNKLYEYIDDATKALNRFEPRRALAELQRLNKFNELETLVPDLYAVSDKHTYDKLVEDAEAAIKQLEDAEALADKAVEETRTAPLTGLLTFQQALEAYEGARHSPHIKQAQDQLLDNVNRYLERQHNEIEADFNNGNFEQAHSQALALIKRYGDIALLSNSEPIRNLVNLRDESAELIRQKQNLSAELRRIESIVDSQPQEASDNLKRLEQEFSKQFLEGDALYIELRYRAGGAVDVDERLQELGRLLSSRDIERVNLGLERAREWANQPFTQNDPRVQSLPSRELQKIRDDFQNAVVNLDFWQKYLEAELLLRNEGYQAAIDAMNNLLRATTAVDENLYRTVEQRLNDLRREAIALDETNRLLEQAQSQLSTSKAPAEIIDGVWKTLLRINLLGNAKQSVNWVQLLQTTFGLITIQTPFNGVLLRQVLSRLEERDLKSYDEWNARLRPMLIAQQARDAQDLQIAHELWQSIRSDFGGDDLAYITRQLNRLNKQIVEQMKERVLSVGVDIKRSPETMNIWLSELNQLVEQLKEFAITATHVLDKLEYMSWVIEVDLAYAQNAIAIQVRYDRLQAISVYANRDMVAPLRQADALTADMLRADGFSSHDKESITSLARRSMDIGKYASRVATALRAVEDNLTEASPFAPFIRAYNEWDNLFNPSSTDVQPDSLNDIIAAYMDSTFWFKEKADSLISNLRAAIRKNNEENRGGHLSENFLNAAKLLYIDAADIDGLTVVRDLTPFTPRLSQTFDTFADSFATGEGYTYDGASGREVLERQQAYVVNQRDYLRLVAEIVSLFPEMLSRTGESLQQISDICHEYMHRFDDFITQIARIQQAGDEYESFLAYFSLTQDNLSRFEDELFSRYDELRAKIDNRSSTDFRFHPFMDELQRKSDETIARMWRYVQILEAVIVVVNEELFEDYVQLIDDPITNEHEFRAMAIYDLFTITDPFDGKIIRGWDAVIRFMRDKYAMWQRIAYWSDPFYEDSDYPAPSHHIVDWESVHDAEIKAIIDRTSNYQSIDAIWHDSAIVEYWQKRASRRDFSEGIQYQARFLIARGEFEHARALLDATLTGREAPHHLLNLEYAREIFNQIPVATQEGETTSDYNFAMDNANSNRGQYRIRWMQQHRHDLYERYVVEAYELRQSIESWNRDLLRIVNDVENAFANLAEEVEKHEARGVLRWIRGGSKNQLHRRVDDIRDALGIMWRLCPLYGSLRDYLNHPILRKALEILDIPLDLNFDIPDLPPTPTFRQTDEPVEAPVEDDLVEEVNETPVEESVTELAESADPISQPTETVEAPATLTYYVGVAVEEELWLVGQEYAVSLLMSSEYRRGFYSVIVPEDTQDIALVVRSQNLKLQGDVRYTVNLNGQLQARNLTAYGTFPADAKVHIDVYVNGTHIDTVTQNVTVIVDPDKVLDVLALPDPAKAADPNAQQADLSIRFVMLPLDNDGLEVRLSVQAFSELPYIQAQLVGQSLGYNDIPVALIDDIQNRIEQLTSGYTSPPVANSDLREIGRMLWQDVFPKRLRQLYNSINNPKKPLRVRSVLLITDEHNWLPYELAMPRDKAWCEEFEMTRWVEGLGQARRTYFPLGLVHVTQDADVSATLPAFKPLEFGNDSGMLPPTSQLAIRDERVQGFHFVRAGGALRGHAKQLALRHDDIDMEAYLRDNSPPIQERSPLVSIATLSNYPEPVGNRLSLAWLKAGASVVIGTYWSVLPMYDRIFWRVFYTQVHSGAHLGEAVANARHAVKAVSHNPLTYLAYYAIGDTMAFGYIPVDGMGNIEVIPAESDVNLAQLEVGKSYTLLATLRREAPVHDTERRCRLRYWQKPPLRLDVDAPRCKVVSEPQIIGHGKHNVTWSFAIEPTEKGNTVLFLKTLYEDGEPFADTCKIDLNIKQLVSVDVPKVDKKVIFVDFTNKQEYFIVNSQRFAYKTQRPSLRDLRRMYEDILDELMLTPKAELAKSVIATIERMMGYEWWQSLQPQSTISIIDDEHSLLWELAAFEREFWGTRFCLGHVPQNWNYPPMSIEARSMTVFSENGMPDYFQTIADRIKLAKASDHVPPHGLLRPDATAEILGSIQVETRANILHIQGSIKDNKFIVPLNSQQSLVFGEHSYQQSHHYLRGNPLVFLDVVSHDDRVYNITSIALQFLKMGAGMVIAPISPLADNINKRFSEVFYGELLQSNKRTSVGETLMQARLQYLNQTQDLRALTFVLFGDPTSVLSTTFAQVNSMSLG